MNIEKSAMTHISIIIFLFFSSIGTAQNDFHKDNEKYNFEERHNKFPFNEAVSVKLISFGIKTKTGDPQNDAEPRIPMDNNKVAFDKLDQIVEISLNQMDTIEDILLNTCYRINATTLMSSMCYIPRNAILFIDSENQVFAYIEICFECKHIRTSSDEIFIDAHICDNTYKDLQAYFIRFGLNTSAYELIEGNK